MSFSTLSSKSSLFVSFSSSSSNKNTISLAFLGGCKDNFFTEISSTVSMIFFNKSLLIGVNSSVNKSPLPIKSQLRLMLKTFLSDSKKLYPGFFIPLSISLTKLTDVFKSSAKDCCVRFLEFLILLIFSPTVLFFSIAFIIFSAWWILQKKQ